MMAYFADYRRNTHFIIFSFISIFIISFVGCKSEDTQKISTRVIPSVVRIETFDDKNNRLGLGSGFIISNDGKIITNYHVLKGSWNAVAKLSNGGFFPISKVLGYDENNDISLVQIDARDLPFLHLGSSKQISIGASVLVIGSPLGLDNTVSNGIISSKREIPDSKFSMLQLTAPISPGSSGSPVLDEKGNVIGIATLQMINGQNLNFAIPIEFANNLKKLEAPISIADLSKLHDINYDPKYTHAFDIAKTDPAGLIKIANELAKSYPFSCESHYILGYAYLKNGLYSGALTELKKATEIDNTQPSVWYMIGLTYDFLGDTDNAIISFEESIKFNPNDSQT